MASGLFNLKQVNQAISQGAWSGYIAPRWVEYLVVAGGGSGGGNGGGGGAGGLLTGIVTVATGTSYTVTVGAGGTGGVYPTQANGNNSVFGSISATAGGKGGGDSASYPAGSGGSGGGSGYYASIGQGTSGQGNAGGAQNGINSGGGGGGAGTVGLNGATSSIGGNGGAGIASAITGTVVTYAGGGGGWANTPGTGGVGGVGGGGSTGAYQGVAGSGGGNTGGGGAGSAGGSGTSGSGGSGIVVVRYPGNVVFFTGGTVNYNNGYIIHIFTSNGTLAPTAPAPYNTSYQISRSLRFNSADSATLNRSLTTPTDNKKFTMSFWLKRSALSAYQDIVSVNASTAFIFTNADILYFGNGSGVASTSAVFRDVSAWYHIVFVYDSANATANDRMIIYVNNVRQALGTNTPPALNATGSMNSATAHYIGSYLASAEYLNGYMTEVNFIDGQALTPSSFGATSTTTGVWAPIQYTGSYGTNGFYLNFSDNSNTTAATLGADYSGNGNNWTPNNFSVTAGAGNDSMVDSPTQYGFDTGVGGTVRGNYATLNPLSASSSSSTFRNGNLDTTVTNGTSSTVLGTVAVSSGKWYWEATPTASSGAGDYMIGVSDATVSGGNVSWTTAYGWAIYASGSKYTSNSGTAYGSSYTTNDVIGLALDMDAGTLVFYKNGVSQGTAFSVFAGRTIVPMLGNGASGSTQTYTVNFGQRPFAYTAPSGFKALCTQNLPTPTIGATSNTLANQFFNPVLYTGNGSTQSITDVGFQPDFTWLKCRSAAEWHSLFDSVRGVLKDIRSNSTNAEVTATATLTAFNSNGFSLGADPDGYGTNTSTRTYVAWNWRAGNNAGASNTLGSITSTVSANTTSGFSIVKYTGNSTAGATVGHGLGVAPAMVIYKLYSATSNWIIYHTSVAPTSALQFTTAAIYSTPAFNNTAPTSSVLNLGGASVGTNDASMIAYCFAPVAGYSAFGSYTGNSSTDGTFVYLGFRPAYMMIKATNAVEDWVIMDVARSPYNGVNLWLNAEDSSADATLTPPQFDFNSNGMKLRGTSSTVNATGTTYIYMAFASNPFKTSLAR
jgi:hypothetical protein